MDRLKLEVENEHERDKNIKFYEEIELDGKIETHIYIYVPTGRPFRTSVTSFIKQFWSQFDPKLISSRIVNSDKMYDPNYIYYGMTQKEIMDRWKNNDAAKLGTKLHNEIELFHNYSFDEYTDTKEFGYFLKYHMDFTRLNPGYKPYRTEWFIYEDSLKMAGSIDMLYKNSEGNILIVDWKRTTLERLYKNFKNKKGLGPFKNLLDTNLNKYTMQLNVYKYMLEKYYLKENEKIVGLYLCVMHPDEDNYKFIQVKTLDDETISFFQELDKF